MEKNKRRTFEERVAARVESQSCIYFNGVQNEVCRVGINYLDLAGGVEFGMALRLPCLNIKTDKKEREEFPKVTCEKRSIPTKEEIEKELKEVDEAIAQQLIEIASGLCPTCKKEIKQLQVGDCVYGTCGHRLYQGEINPEFAA